MISSSANHELFSWLVLFDLSKALNIELLCPPGIQHWRCLLLLGFSLFVIHQLLSLALFSNVPLSTVAFWSPLFKKEL